MLSLNNEIAFCFLMILLAAFFVSVNVYAIESPQDQIKKFVEILEKEVQKKELYEEWNADISVSNNSVLLVFTNKTSKGRAGVKIGTLDKNLKPSFKRISEILTTIDDRLKNYKDQEKRIEQYILSETKKMVDDYNNKHETNIVVRTVRVTFGEEPNCIQATVFFWDNTQRSFGFCPDVVTPEKFPSFLRRNLKLDGIRTLDDYESYYTKDKKINALLDEIKELGGQLYIQKYSLTEWRLFIKNNQAKIILETELEFLNKKTKTKTERPCPPNFRSSRAIPS